MKLSINPLVAAVSLALISVSAHAQLVPPAQGSAVPSNDGLFLEAWNATSGATELVNLSYAYTDIAGANLGNLNTASGPAWTSATNPSTGTGSVEQLNFGTIANNTAGAFNNYVVVAAATTLQTGTTSIEGLAITSGGNPSTITKAGTTTVVQNIQEEIANWSGQTGATGTFFDSNGSTTIAALGAPSTSGTWNNGGISSVAVGSAGAFYNVLANTAATGTSGGVPHGTAVTTTYAGFWFLSSAGQLTYNIVAEAAPVPLPAAVWLLGSGLMGLIGVGRRRRAAAV
jgi:hypothetical protein